MHTFAKSKPITLGVFYRTPNQASLIELIMKGFSHVNMKDNGIYFFGDFWPVYDIYINDFFCIITVDSQVMMPFMSITVDIIVDS